MIRNIKTITVCFTGLLVLLTGCFNPMSRPVDDGPSTGELSVSVDHARGKTILPDIPEIKKYLLTFSEGPVSFDPVETNDTTPSITLPVGSWAVTVEGKDENGTTLVSGSTTGIKIEHNKTTAVAIILKALESGSGTVDITLSWPAGKPVLSNAVSARLNGSDINNTYLTKNATSIRYNQTLPTGSYRLAFLLKDANNTVLAYVESAVQVNGNLKSSSTITLAAADFTSPPSGPTGLQSTAGDSNRTLTWTDESNIETGYIIERSIENNSSFSAIASLNANTVGYVDTNVTGGTLYYYRVKAVNTFGSSGYSSVVYGDTAAPVPGNSGLLSTSNLTISSFTLGWTKGSDISTLQNNLLYKVVISTANNIGTVSEAQLTTNGRSVVQDWAADIAEKSISGLSTGTTYYITVLVKDRLNYISKYETTTLTTSGTGSFTISHELPGSQTITYSQTDYAEFSISGGDATVTVNETFDTYEWYLDGTKEASTVNIYTINCSGLLPGMHRLTMYGTKNSLLFSKQFVFKIIN